MLRWWLLAAKPVTYTLIMYLFSLVPYMIINCVHIVLWMKRQGAHSHMQSSPAQFYTKLNHILFVFTIFLLRVYFNTRFLLLLCLLISLASFHYSYSKGFFLSTTKHQTYFLRLIVIQDSLLCFTSLFFYRF